MLAPVMARNWEHAASLLRRSEAPRNGLQNSLKNRERRLLRGESCIRIARSFQNRRVTSCTALERAPAKRPDLARRLKSGRLAPRKAQFSCSFPVNSTDAGSLGVVQKRSGPLQHLRSKSETRVAPTSCARILPSAASFAGRACGVVSARGFCFRPVFYREAAEAAQQKVVSRRASTRAPRE
jgi:hypothetical protein